MKYFSTNGQVPLTNLEEAVLKGLPDDNGLYMPEKIPSLSEESLAKQSFQDLAFDIAHAFVDGEIADERLRKIIDKAIDFEAPVVALSEQLHCLELFHGPSMAFKDFGARFMAGLMSEFLQKQNQKVHILVATSGDTGGAVAQGFYGVENIDVTILYPSGKVSDIQEQQLTTLGKNIRAIEIEGSFDDCQALVKQAFLDKEITSKHTLASANSINLARLIPQAFYYLNAYRQLGQNPLVFVVPSGNFGNLCAGVLVHKMGMPVEKFVAATNLNKVVPSFLQSGTYQAISPSIPTISNAMDVGNPSNFPRLFELYNRDFETLRQNIEGYFYDDNQTKDAIIELKEKYHYLACPHTAIGYLAAKEYIAKSGTKAKVVFLSTAHYAKFLPIMEPLLGKDLAIPERLNELLDKKKEATLMKADYFTFKNWLLSNL